MGKHVVVGAGQVGAHLAEELAGAGHEVVVVTRSGSGPAGERIERVAADAGDGPRLARITEGADALYNCVNMAYHRWPQDWPPVADALLAAAEHNGAGLVILGNLYGYGPVDGPITEDLPLASAGSKGRVRAKMWADALAAHEAGRLRATEVRASDFFGPGMSKDSVFGYIAPILDGKPVRVPAPVDHPHSFTYIPDVARALAAAGTGERAWGRAWHVPTLPAVTIRELVERLAAAAGAPAPRVSAIPHIAMRAAGLFVPMVRELEETRYQFDRPFILDSSAFESVFGLTPTPLEAQLKETVAWLRAR
ncbi:NAD-dependent epimerase [Sphaerisporangium melleum]|uniref:NAD-dependent epimerase n=1 Tax=Sphaerisporangium melleum TaxID=321316 RepID=A0A917RJG9_9ACTN|nr:NAD-dependent epimerase/dehydratase family protein [Sphaerisporangium melleum]GGL10875.1 NAD-dependent epimerase [Sphaerisporangium melleum]GII69089.1 NAD-dependent epimerase [Sphaerisporangium melleum]